MTDVFIGIGSNLGDRLGNLGRALLAVGRLDDTVVVAVSHAVESEPWGVADQPPFANAVARVETGIPADRFLDALKDIESTLGRTPGERFGPRVIDLDILLFGDDEWDSPDLTVPHPRLAERAFAVIPLLEIWPDAEWPDGSPLTAGNATQGRVTAVLGAVPGFEELTPATHPAHEEDPGAWVVVASEVLNVHGGITRAAGILFDAAVLEQEGIPVAWEPVRPGDDISPYPLPVPHRLLVPPALADRARALLAEVRAATPVPEDDMLL